MSGNVAIQLDLSSLIALPRDPPEDPLHLIPARIESNGDAKVSQYFTAAIQCKEEELQVSYRGRALQGRELPVPPGYVGLVLKEDREPSLEEEEERTVRVKSTFSSLTYWNLETPPTADDTVVMALNWPQLAEALQAPVEDE